MSVLFVLRLCLLNTGQYYCILYSMLIYIFNYFIQNWASWQISASAHQRSIYIAQLSPQKRVRWGDSSGSICSDPFSVGAEILKHAIAQHCLLLNCVCLYFWKFLQLTVFLLHTVYCSKYYERKLVTLYNVPLYTSELLLCLYLPFTR